ncbi:N-acetyltransferase 8 [Tenrec ecaudatus]|uniref:N-acetyltransferase 8 n=1 Tax=Tenrec ecaudatus TaxID=94439 RepID=UPI003F5AA06F
MAPHRIRRYQESDWEGVLDLFQKGLDEYSSPTFHYLLGLPRVLVPLLGGPLALLLVSGSWLLALAACLTLLAALRFIAKYPWTSFGVTALNTDMSDITQTYFSERGSCFWVVECEGQVVGMVGCLPAEEPALRRKRLQLLHLFVALEHRGRGVAKALTRTVLQFAREQAYQEVVLSTSRLQRSALGLYRGLGFQETHECYYSWIWRLVAIPGVHFLYRLKQPGGP